ncbi:MAG: class I SAM-dependent methyltransferase [Xanthomonadales bacterium]|jgi:SAM-dependent methyltransferase|nr:class I SAM-dependent methyltransferase [Xanthomonadales bacterium]
MTPTLSDPARWATLADAELDALRRAHPADLALHDWIETTRPALSFGRWMRVDCRIDPRDEIFRFFATHPSSLNPVRDYLADGWRSLAELLTLLDRCGRRLSSLDSLLEYASGYGRLTRHLAPLLPGRLWVADVMPGATDFAARCFGTLAAPAVTDPGALRFERAYEVVFVLSLFTHLPPARWGAWLRALDAAVAPGGLLIFSVHSEGCDLPPGLASDADGVCFEAASESSHLDSADYGTTYTGRAWVTAQVEAALGRVPLLQEGPWFWAGQDAVVVEKPRSAAG